MEGHTHAATGVLLGAGVSLLALRTGHSDAVIAHNIGQTALFALVTGGLALLPDADHHDASFAHAAGPLSAVIAHTVGLLFGGHRYGMHSIPGIALFSALTAWATLWTPNRWALGAVAVMLAVCVAAGLRATRFARNGFEALLAGCLVAGFAVYLVRADLWWLCALGMALHVAEDQLTGHGCALLWPFSHRRFGGDGRQPAADRRKTGAVRNPAAAKSKSKRGAAASVAAPVPRRKTTRSKPPAGLPVPVLQESGKRLTWNLGARCAECVTGAHPECEDKGCQCTRGKHPNRPGAAAARIAAPLPEDPPF